MNIFSVILILVILATLSIVYSFFFSTPIGIALGTTLLGVGLLLYLWVRHDLSHH